MKTQTNQRRSSRRPLVPVVGGLAGLGAGAVLALSGVWGGGLGSGIGIGLAALGGFFGAGWWQGRKNLEDEGQSLEVLDRHLREETKEHRRLLGRIGALSEIRRPLWPGPAPARPAAFFRREERAVRFLALLNLKGGVGKTTLAAHLAPELAKCAGRGRVLLVDLDFQGSLSDLCCAPGDLLEALEGRRHAGRLLEAGTPDLEAALEYSVPMEGVGGVRVLVADDRLDLMDFRAQTLFHLHGEIEDPRFLFREIFHRRDIDQHLDLVIFDCPPRLTPACINAITCADSVLIPTKLDPTSANAVGRTLVWLEELAPIHQAEVLGGVGNEVRLVDGQPIPGMREVRAELDGIPGFGLCEHLIPDLSLGRPGSSGEIFGGLAAEIWGKMRGGVGLLGPGGGRLKNPTK